MAEKQLVASCDSALLRQGTAATAKEGALSMAKSWKAKARLGTATVVLLTLGVLTETHTSARPAEAFTNAKFEPADGMVYTGAGQSIESIVQMTNAGDPARKPVLVAGYDFLNPTFIKNVNVYEPRMELLIAHNLYPGSKLQVGMEFPKDNLTELTAVGNGKYDNWLRGMARSYKALNQDIFLRPGYEFDGAWNKYDPAAYIAAFRRLVDIFRAEGASNVAFVWNSYTPDQDSATTTATGYRWNGNPMFAWYPGDSYVDWFSFNEWKNGFDSTWFMAQAAAHGKPVLIGEQSFTRHLDSGYTFEQWVPGHFSSVKSSGAKGFQYINWNWPIYPITDWSAWSSGKYTATPSHVAAYNTEMQDAKYLVRDGSYYNPVPLWVGAARAAGSTVNGAPWSKSLDEASLQPGYDYSVPAGQAYYGDGWSTYWANATGTSELAVNLTVPAGSSGYIHMGAYASYLGHDVYAGTRKVLSGIKPTGSVKFKYLPSDLSGTTLVVKVVEPDTSSIHIDSIGIQTISPSAPAVPTGLAVGATTANSATLNWTGVANSLMYNIYRNGQLVGTSRTNSFTDTNLPFGATYQYAVSAWADRNGEGDISTPVTVTTRGTLTDDLNDWSLSSSHSAGMVLDTTTPVNFGGDASRATRTTRNDEYISYEATGINTVSFDLYYTNNAKNAYANAAASSSGPYTTVTLSQTAPVLTANGWYKVTYTGTVPAGKNNLGIHLIGGTLRTTKNQQIGSVRISN